MTFKQRQILIFLQLKAKEIGIFLIYASAGVGAFDGLVSTLVWMLHHHPYVCHIGGLIAQGFIFTLFGLMILGCIIFWLKQNWREAYYIASAQTWEETHKTKSGK